MANQQEEQQHSPSFMASMLMRYESMWQVFIQPKRKQYPRDALGPKKKRIDREHFFERQDKQILNRHNHRLVYTYYALQNTEEQDSNSTAAFLKRFNRTSPFSSKETKYCMIYLHSHGGCRTEGVYLTSYCGSLGIDLCVFDFAGSGQSGGEYTTLGFDEADDIQDVISQLVQNNPHDNMKFLMWGRSMGAVAALVHQSRYPASPVEYLILDSPFNSVERLIRDASEYYVSFGEYLSMLFYSPMLEIIKKKTGHDLSDLQPIQLVENITVPAFFIVAQDDNLVLPERVREMKDKYGGKVKRLLEVSGNHESSRTHDNLEVVFSVIQSHLGVQFANPINEPVSNNPIQVQTPVLQKFEDLNINIPGLKEEIRQTNRGKAEPAGLQSPEAPKGGLQVSSGLNIQNRGFSQKYNMSSGNRSSTLNKGKGNSLKNSFSDLKNGFEDPENNRGSISSSYQENNFGMSPARGLQSGVISSDIMLKNSTEFFDPFNNDLTSTQNKTARRRQGGDEIFKKAISKPDNKYLSTGSSNREMHLMNSSGNSSPKDMIGGGASNHFYTRPKGRGRNRGHGVMAGGNGRRTMMLQQQKNVKASFLDGGLKNSSEKRVEEDLVIPFEAQIRARHASIHDNPMQIPRQNLSMRNNQYPSDNEAMITRDIIVPPHDGVGYGGGGQNQQRLKPLPTNRRKEQMRGGNQHGGSSSNRRARGGDGGRNAQSYKIPMAANTPSTISQSREDTFPQSRIGYKQQQQQYQQQQSGTQLKKSPSSVFDYDFSGNQNMIQDPFLTQNLGVTASNRQLPSQNTNFSSSINNMNNGGIAENGFGVNQFQKMATFEDQGSNYPQKQQYEQQLLQQYGGGDTSLWNSNNSLGNGRISVADNSIKLATSRNLPPKNNQTPKKLIHQNYNQQQHHHHQQQQQLSYSQQGNYPVQDFQQQQQFYDHPNTQQLQQQQHQQQQQYPQHPQLQQNFTGRGDIPKMSKIGNQLNQSKSLASASQNQSMKLGRNRFNIQKNSSQSHTQHNNSSGSGNTSGMNGAQNKNQIFSFDSKNSLFQQNNIKNSGPTRNNEGNNRKSQGRNPNIERQRVGKLNGRKRSTQNLKKMDSNLKQPKQIFSNNFSMNGGLFQQNQKQSNNPNNKTMKDLKNNNFSRKIFDDDPIPLSSQNRKINQPEITSNSSLRGNDWNKNQISQKRKSHHQKNKFQNSNNSSFINQMSLQFKQQHQQQQQQQSQQQNQKPSKKPKNMKRTFDSLYDNQTYIPEGINNNASNSNNRIFEASLKPQDIQIPQTQDFLNKVDPSHKTGSKPSKRYRNPPKRSTGKFSSTHQMKRSSNKSKEGTNQQHHQQESRNTDYRRQTRGQRPPTTNLMRNRSRSYSQNANEQSVHYSSKVNTPSNKSKNLMLASNRKSSRQSSHRNQNSRNSSSSHLNFFGGEGNFNQSINFFQQYF